MKKNKKRSQKTKTKRAKRRVSQKRIAKRKTASPKRAELGFGASTGFAEFNRAQYNAGLSSAELRGLESVRSPHMVASHVFGFRCTLTRGEWSPDAAADLQRLLDIDLGQEVYAAHKSEVVALVAELISGDVLDAWGRADDFDASAAADVWQVAGKNAAWFLSLLGDPECAANAIAAITTCPPLFEACKDEVFAIARAGQVLPRMSALFGLALRTKEACREEVIQVAELALSADAPEVRGAAAMALLKMRAMIRVVLSNEIDEFFSWDPPPSVKFAWAPSALRLGPQRAFTAIYKPQPKFGAPIAPATSEEHFAVLEFLMGHAMTMSERGREVAGDAFCDILGLWFDQYNGVNVWITDELDVGQKAWLEGARSSALTLRAGEQLDVDDPSAHEGWCSCCGYRVDSDEAIEAHMTKFRPGQTYSLSIAI